MSACAGSSTKRTMGQLARMCTRKFTSCLPRNSPARKRFSFRHFAGQVPMDRAPGRIGFMSTQRRESRWRRQCCTEGTGASRLESLAPLAFQVRANANDGTAPPRIAAGLATNSLQLGDRNAQLVQLVQFVQFVLRIRLVQLVQLAQLVSQQDDRIGSPPPGAERLAVSGTPATRRSSLPHIPSPSGLARLHRTLPRVPAGRRRWAERYDGKGNMHLQHAA
jgi:hypothetical protein